MAAAKKPARQRTRKKPAAAPEDKSLAPATEDKAAAFPATTTEPEPETVGEKISRTARRKRQGPYYAI